jgi:hypothetical protein
MTVAYRIETERSGRVPGDAALRGHRREPAHYGAWRNSTSPSTLRRARAQVPRHVRSDQDQVFALLDPTEQRSSASRTAHPSRPARELGYCL